MGTAHLRPSATAAAGLAGRGRRHGARRRRRSHTDIPAGTPVVAGTVDAYSEAFSVGVRHPGDQMLMYGSTMFLVQIIDEYYSDPALWTTTGVEPRHAGAGRGHLDRGQPDRTGCRRSPAAHRSTTLMAEAQSRATGQRRTADVALPRRRADPGVRPAGAGRFRRPDLAPRPRTSVPRRLRGNRVRHPADPRAIRRRPHAQRGRWQSAADCAARSGRRRSATSPGGRSSSRSRPSAPATATPCWPPSASGWCRPTPTGRRSPVRSSRIRGNRDLYERPVRDVA